MPDFLKTTLTGGPVVAPGEVLVRLLVALVLGGVVAWIYRRTRRNIEVTASFPVTLVLLTVRVGLGHDLERLLGGTLETHLQGRALMRLATAKQGISLDVAYEARLRRTGSADELVRALNRLEGVQHVELQRRGLDGD